MIEVGKHYSFIRITGKKFEIEVLGFDPKIMRLKYRLHGNNYLGDSVIHPLKKVEHDTFVEIEGDNIISISS